MALRYFEDFITGAVTELGSVAVSEEDIIAFAGQFDPQDFHMDPEAARRSGFGGIVASGWHTAGLYMRLLVEGVLKDHAGLGSPGVDAMRWPHPVRPGDRLSARVTVGETRLSQSKPDRGIVKFHGEVQNQRGEIVLTIIGTAMLRRRPA